MTLEHKTMSEQKKDLIRKIAQEEIKKALLELRKELYTLANEKMSEEDLFSPLRYYAIYFPDEESKERGTKVILYHLKECVVLRHGVFLLWEKDAQLLDRAGVKYEKYEPKSALVREIYEYFGVSEAEQ